MTYPFDPFAEIAKEHKTGARNGVAYEDLAATAHNVYCRSLGVTPPELREADSVPWADVASRAVSIIDVSDSEQAELQVSAKALAKSLYCQYDLSKNLVPSWEEISLENKLAWEAVGRHLANIIDSDGQQDFSDMEFKMASWVSEKLSTPQLSLS